ncbi:hypothetical protein AB6A40_006089 [Gnathostoma spinigerum]|uniref:WW domain-binding protein 4 n=1 Tax=Gnathostoma spinigerum TaxID=75299 RepID=A0ABD6ET01_9BILA
MTDVWKSNARKFCELCKVWFADNKVSIEHHEGGQKHKAAIQAKIKELGKKSKQHEREQSALQTTLALMESEARKSMKKDSSGVTSANLPCSTIGPSPKPRTYLDPKAHSSSIAAMAREMALRKKEKCEKQKNTITSSKSATEVEAKKKFDGGTQKKEESRVWVEVRTTDNIPYYFHIYSGEAVWDKPDSYFTPEEYAEYLKTACNTNTHSDTTNISNDVKSEDLKNDIPTPPPNQLQKQSAADERNVCSDAIIRKPMDNYSLHAEHSSSQHHPVHLPPVINTADIPLPDSCPPPAVSELAAISFPKQEVSLAPSDAGSGTSVQEKIASTFLAAKVTYRIDSAAVVLTI